MTEGHITELNDWHDRLTDLLEDQIMDLENALEELKCAESFRLYGYNSATNVSYMIDSLEDSQDLKTLIIKYYENKLEKLQKELEEMYPWKNSSGYFVNPDGSIDCDGPIYER